MSSETITRNDLKNILNEVLPPKVCGVTKDYTTLSITNDTAFTCPASGWLVCVFTCNSGQTIAPYVSLEVYDGSTNVGIIDTSWGITTNGSYLSVSAPVSSGQNYRVHALRCTMTSARVYKVG